MSWESDHYMNRDRDRRDSYEIERASRRDLPPVTVPDAKVVTQTDLAILVEVGGGTFTDGEKKWVPRSVVHDDSEVYDATPDGRGPGDLIIQGWSDVAEHFAELGLTS